MTAKITVLVVEDEPLILMDMVEELTDRGFDVLEAHSAAQALKILAAHAEIRILFTDVDMPGGMDGLMLAKAVRDRWPPIAIVVTSGHRSVSQNDMPANSRFCEKPCNPDRLAKAFREMAA